MLPSNSFKFASPRGWQIWRKILTDALPFGPHCGPNGSDYQLDGITHALDGQDVVAVSATGSGKSAYIYMLAVLLLALANNFFIAPVGVSGFSLFGCFRVLDLLLEG